MRMAYPEHEGNHEHVRALRCCPLCLGEKTQGLLVCWPCDKEQIAEADLDGDYTEEANARLDVIEEVLTTDALIRGKQA